MTDAVSGRNSRSSLPTDEEAAAQGSCVGNLAKVVKLEADVGNIRKKMEHPCLFQLSGLFQPQVSRTEALPWPMGPTSGSTASHLEAQPQGDSLKAQAPLISKRALEGLTGPWRPRAPFAQALGAESGFRGRKPAVQPTDLGSQLRSSSCKTTRVKKKRSAGVGKERAWLRREEDGSSRGQNSSDLPTPGASHRARDMSGT